MLRGERFNIVTDGDDAETLHPSAARVEPVDHKFEARGVLDVTERQPLYTASVKPPTFKGPTGFPAPYKRSIPSKRSTAPTSIDTASIEWDVSPARSPGDAHTSDRETIDLENRQRIDRMSSAEVAKEKEDLLKFLSPSLVSKLMQRSSIDGEDGHSIEPTQASRHSIASVQQGTQRKQGSDLSPDQTQHKQSTGTIPRLEAQHALGGIGAPNSKGTMHFPKPINFQDTLDPGSATFFEDLHSRYYPDLPADPSKLAWMSNTEQKLSYQPDQDSVKIQDVRFSFSGAILPPSESTQIPVTQGLHHHGDAPDAAGYTVPELAHLSRSSFPAQRSMSFITLGRILYKLGAGEFGPAGTPLAQGISSMMEQGRVLDTLHDESVRSDGHASARAYATEALWLWQKGNASGKVLPAT